LGVLSSFALRMNNSFACTGGESDKLCIEVRSLGHVEECPSRPGLARATREEAPHIATKPGIPTLPYNGNYSQSECLVYVARFPLKFSF